MKRILLTLIGTVGGLVALLSFKTSQPQAASGPLPSAGLPTAPGSTTTSSGAGPDRSPSPAVSKSSAATARSFLGSAVTTRYGVVQVKVTVVGTRIMHVGLAQLTAFDQHSQDINSQAAPQLLSETLSAQSAHIDTVSGATYTSVGYEQSLQSALDAAGIR